MTRQEAAELVANLTNSEKLELLDEIERLKQNREPSEPHLRSNP